MTQKKHVKNIDIFEKYLKVFFEIKVSEIHGGFFGGQKVW